MFCQPELEALLQQRADSLLAVDVRRGVRVTSLDQDDDHVVLGVADGGRVAARYVVGCDGANSTVRSLLGVDVDDRGFYYDWLIVDLVLDDPDRIFDPVNVQICDPARPTTAVSGGPGRRRWEFMRLPGERAEDLDEAWAWARLEAWDVHPGNARLERHALYTFQARTAAAWQVGRVFLADDAAHQMPPFAGQGMCAGIRDAVNLAWKLDLVLDGRAAPDLLATYDEERRPNALAAIDFSVELGKVICVPDPDDAAARDAAMTAGFDGSVSEAPGLPGIASGLVALGAPLAGELLPQADLGGRWFDDVHGAGWRLVTVGPSVGIDGLDPASVDWFGSIGGAVVDASGAAGLVAWLHARGVRWALQRPDFHLFGAAPDQDAAEALLADLRGRLVPTETR
jgi:2-polyprenyl-6-methoxyphenol hydroxylase-like FAD-dependent oxidoreductase